MWNKTFKVIFKFKLFCIFFLLFLSITSCIKNDSDLGSYDYSGELTGPYVNIISPEDNQNVNGTVEIKAAAVDDTDISYIEFYINDELVSTDYEGPYTHTWDVIPLSECSEHTLYAIGYDNLLNRTKSAEISVRVNNSEFDCEDECYYGLDDCDDNATCINTDEGYTCKCKAGWSGDGYTCDDIDECSLGIHNCDDNATCTNTYGSYECECNPGYCGDGVDCIKRTKLMICGSSNRDVSTFIRSCSGLTVESSCSPDDETQALLVTRSGSIPADGSEWRNYLENGGQIITEYSISNEIFSIIFSSVVQGSLQGSCWDRVVPAVKFFEDDSFWQDNLNIETIALADSGCGYSMDAYPGITPLGGWTASTVSLAYRDLGMGRLWLVDIDWQDNESAWNSDDEQLMRYMVAGGIPIIHDNTYETVMTFSEAPSLTMTTMIVAWDGTNLWSCTGGSSSGNRLARYDADGSNPVYYQPGIDFRSVFTRVDGIGPILARGYNSNDILVQTSPGVFATELTLTGHPGGSLYSQSNVVYDNTRDQFIAFYNGTLSRWDDTGVYIDSIAFNGWGDITGETGSPQYRGIAVSNGYYFTYYNGTLSVWDENGNRIATPILNGAGTDFDSYYSLSFAQCKIWIIDDARGTWRGYDVIH